MEKSTRQVALETGHLDFLVNAMVNNNADSITEWVQGNLINDNPSTDQQSKKGFYSAATSLILEYIERNECDKLSVLLNAIDNEKFKDEVNSQKLKVNECKILAYATKESQKSLGNNEDQSMCNSLRALLTEKYNKLTDRSLKQKVSTTVNEALRILSYTDNSQTK